MGKIVTAQGSQELGQSKMENYKGGKTLSLEDRRFANITGKHRPRLCPGY